MLNLKLKRKPMLLSFLVQIHLFRLNFLQKAFEVALYFSLLILAIKSNQNRQINCQHSRTSVSFLFAAFKKAVMAFYTFSAIKGISLEKSLLFFKLLFPLRKRDTEPKTSLIFKKKRRIIHVSILCSISFLILFCLNSSVCLFTVVHFFSFFLFSREKKRKKMKRIRKKRIRTKKQMEWTLYKNLKEQNRILTLRLNVLFWIWKIRHFFFLTKNSWCYYIFSTVSKCFILSWALSTLRWKVLNDCSSERFTQLNRNEKI